MTQLGQGRKGGALGKWSTLIVLGIAQFLMVLDTSVMNVFLSRKLPTKRVDEIAAETREAEAALAPDEDVP